MMLKICLLFAFVAVLQTFAHADDKAYEKAREDCEKELKYTPQEMELTKDGRIFGKAQAKTATPHLKCYAECFFKKLSMLNADNSLNLPVVKLGLTELHNSDVKKVEALMEKCKDEIKTGANNCEKVYNFAVCVHDS